MSAIQPCRQNADTKKYYLGFKLVELGNRLLSQIDLRTEARPFLVELAESLGLPYREIELR